MLPSCGSPRTRKAQQTLQHCLEGKLYKIRESLSRPKSGHQNGRYICFTNRGCAEKQLDFLSKLKHYSDLAIRGKPDYPKTRTTSIQNLTARVDELSSRRQEIIRPAIENPREYVLLTIRSLAERLGTDPATVVRIVRAMGFADFKSFKSYLHELSLSHATALDLMQSGMTKDTSVDAHTRGSLDQDFKNMTALRHTLDMTRVNSVAKRLSSARQILLLSGDLAACLGAYLEYQFTMLGYTVLAATGAGRVIHLSRIVTSKDVAVAMSFRRGLRQTVDGLQCARENGAYCIGITDTYISPIARYANEFFLASVETPSFGASYAAPVALLNILLLACCQFAAGPHVGDVAKGRGGAAERLPLAYRVTRE